LAAEPIAAPPSASTEPELPAIAFASAGDASQAEPVAEQELAAARDLIAATRDAASAAALLAALLQPKPPASLDWPPQWQQAASAYPAVRRQLTALPVPAAQAMRWPLLELAAARIRDLPASQRLALLERIKALIEADGRITVAEWIGYSLLRIRLAPAAPRAAGDPMPKSQAVRWIVALLARVSGVSEARAARAANAAVRLLGLAPIGSAAPQQLSLAGLDQAIAAISKLPPLQKPLLLRRLLELMPIGDSPESHDLLRVLCLAIDCPVPRRRLHAPEPPTVPASDDTVDSAAATALHG
ncbi:MAG TPA: hypothetical protein VM491_07230, partial [Burkholderiaceae bacterium]|nr:hypothetical protein [Burkholderiaceae bacterium]